MIPRSKSQTGHSYVNIVVTFYRPDKSRDLIQATTAVKMLQNKGFNESYNGSAGVQNLCTFPSQRTQNKQVHTKGALFL